MVLNTLTSEFVIIDNPLMEVEVEEIQTPQDVCGVHLMNQFAFIYGKQNWCRFDLRGNLVSRHESPEDTSKWSILGK